MPPAGRPRVRTDQGFRAPTNLLAAPGNQQGAYFGSVADPFRTPSNSAWQIFIDEFEYVAELRWPNNVWLFDQMRTDSQLAGLLTATLWGITQLRFVLDRNGADQTMTEEISQDLNVPIMGEDDAPRRRMKHRFSHSRFVFQALLAAIYGHYFFEQNGVIVDGKWRLRKMFPIQPHTIRQINIADDGGLVSIQQYASKNYLANYGIPPEVPVDRLAGFIFQMEGMNWTGRSMLRDVYKDWLLKDRDSRIEAINHERAGGVPYAEGAMGMTQDELSDLDAMMRQFRIGDTAGGAVPYGSKINIARGSGSDVNATIKRLDESMARRFLLQLMNLAQGGQNVGSYALGETFMDSFLIGQRVIAQWYCDTVTEHIVEDWVDWNYGEETDLTPQLTWERSTEDSLGVDALALLVERGIITVDEDLENVIRYRYMLPKLKGPRPPDKDEAHADLYEKQGDFYEAQADEIKNPPEPSVTAPAPGPTTLPGIREPRAVTASAGAEGTGLLPPPEAPAISGWRRFLRMGK